MNMTIFLYRWKIKNGHERQFEDSWAVITKAILAQCGSYGSRLHLDQNGEYVAYAQWPDAETRSHCDLSPSLSPARTRMRDAIEMSYPEVLLTVKSDYLVTPDNPE